MATLLEFAPENAIERRILAARTGDVSGDAVMLEMAAADLFVPSTRKADPEGSGFRPVLLEQDGISFVAAFTATGRQPRDMAAYALRMTGRHFFLRLPPGYGAVLNPGYDAQMLLPPEGVTALQQDLKKTQSS
ncbi:MAG: hypothetical protein BGN82_05980 [Alphaproteobacteria bacterium 65-7]|nr:MAG: hypothetical protein BGN82_05980 [Alphaproteobacteria bacterium 65-7]